MRRLFSLLVLASAAILPAAAHADTYTFSLINQAGNVCSGANCTAGTGTFTINAAPPTAINSQQYYYDNGTALTALSFTLDGRTLDLSDILTGTASTTYVRFTSGALDAIGYFGFGPNSSFQISLSSNGLTYLYSDGPSGVSSSGIISNVQIASAATTTSAVPEPSTLLLFGTGTLGIAALGLRRLYA